MTTRTEFIGYFRTFGYRMICENPERMVIQQLLLNCRDKMMERMGPPARLDSIVAGTSRL